jgi:4-hydroxy-4-methyl-2-oxoglutarate aldolase
MPEDARAAEAEPAGMPRLARTAPEVVTRLAACGVVAAHEVSGRTGLLDPSLRPIQHGIRIAGSAVTVSCPPDDNLAIHLAVEHCVPGDVLVVAVTDPSDAGVLGELLATSLRAHGVIGAVIDAGVRDVAELREMGFPVWSRWVSARGTTKRAAISVNRSVVCAGQVIEPGDVIIADDDGVMCVAAGTAASVAERATERVAHEDVLRARLAAGELSVDLLGLRAGADPGGLEPGDP